MTDRREYGKGSIRKRSRKRGVRYEAQIYLGVDPISGKPRFTSKSHTSEKAAERWLREQRSAGLAGALSTSATVGRLLSEWLEVQRHRVEVSGTISESTLSWYAGAIRRHLEPKLGHLEAAKVTASDVASFLSDRQESGGPGGRPLGKSSIRRLTIILRAVFAHAAAEGWIDRSPMDRIELPRVEAAKARERVWPIDQVRRFLDHTAETPLGPLWRVLAVTGLRRGEALGLRWSDVSLPDIGQSALEVRRTYVVVDGRAEFSNPKTDRSRRRVPIDEGTASVLEEARATQRAAFGADWTPDFPVFARPDLAPWHPNVATRTFQRTARDLGLEPIGPHGLRHSVATELGEQGVPLTVVSRLLGHSSVRVTGDVYSHVFEETAGEAVSQIALALGHP